MANDLCERCRKGKSTFKYKLERKPFLFPDFYYEICGLCYADLTETSKECYEPIKKDPMLNKLTPLDIEVLLHYWVCPDPYPRYAVDAVQQSIEMFIDAGLMTLTGSENGIKVNCKITEGGRMLVEALCSTPLPVQKWVMPERDEK